MPGLVGQYAVAPYTTPSNGDDLDAAVVVSHDNTTASAHTSHDGDSTIHLQSSTLANRPAFGTVGRKWLTTDTALLYYDSGTAWVQIGAGIPNPITQDLLFTDALYDIGKSGATRPRDGFFSRNVTVGGNLVVSGVVNSNLLFSDDSWDIGSSGATRPRYGYFTRDVVVGQVSGKLIMGSAITTGANASEIVLPNAKAVRGSNNAASTTLAMLMIDTADRLCLGGATSVVDSGQANLRIPHISSSNLPAAGAAQNGFFVIDATNHRLCWYDSGNRYYVAGTAF